jgi:hypothetical protein
MPFDYTQPGMYCGPGVLPKIRVFDGTTTDGIATFIVTEDEDIEGELAFAEIYSLVPVPVRNTTTPSEYPFASIKSISVDLKTIEVNVGTTAGNVPNGTTVTLTVFGAK